MMFFKSTKAPKASVADSLPAYHSTKEMGQTPSNDAKPCKWRYTCSRESEWRGLSPPPSVIKARDVPQWKWDMRQTRAWVVRFLVDECHWDSKVASEKGNKFPGNGMVLYMTQIRWWTEWLQSDGLAISSIVCAIRRRGGGTRGQRWSVYALLLVRDKLVEIRKVKSGCDRWEASNIRIYSKSRLPS